MHFRFALTNNSFRKKAQEIILNRALSPNINVVVRRSACEFSCKFSSSSLKQKSFFPTNVIVRLPQDWCTLQALLPQSILLRSFQPPPGGGGYSVKFYKGKFSPKVQPLTDPFIYGPILTEKVPLWYNSSLQMHSNF